MILTRFLSGLDLGQASDYSALVITEQSARPDPAFKAVPLNSFPQGPVSRLVPMVSHYAVRHLERWPRGTSYPKIVTDVRDMFATPPLAHSHLLIDETGVGRAVVDLFRVTLPPITARVLPFSVTCGRVPTYHTVPKKDLVAAVQAVMGTGRLVIAPELELASVLTKEMEMFRAKVTPDRNESFSSWRESDHDDILFSLSLTLWYGERLGPPSSGAEAVPMVLGGNRLCQSRWLKPLTEW